MISEVTRLSPVQSQVIPLYDTVLLIHVLLGTKFQWHYNRKTNMFRHGNVSEYAICMTLAIILIPEYVTDLADESE